MRPTASATLKDWAIIGFVDGTENPSALDTPEYAVIGDEDPAFENGSYAFAQKYQHNLDAWNDLSTEDQEKAIGRKKFNDLELDDEAKLANSHNVVSQDNDGGVEHKIVRMNVPFSNPAERSTAPTLSAMPAIGPSPNGCCKGCSKNPTGYWTFQPR